MNKVLTRNLFKNVYLQSVSKQIARFKDGGLASLRAKRFSLGGPIFTQGERELMIASPLLSSLLTGTKRPGQSEASAVASNLGAGLPGVVNTALQIGKIEEEGRKKPDLRAVIDTVTGEPKFVTSTELISDIANKTNRYVPQEGNIPQMIKATTATEEIKVQKKKEGLAKDNVCILANSSLV